jgi:hypothetical protein
MSFQRRLFEKSDSIARMKLILSMELPLLIVFFTVIRYNLMSIIDCNYADTSKSIDLYHIQTVDCTGRLRCHPSDVADRATSAALDRVCPREPSQKTGTWDRDQGRFIAK